jgi:nitrogen fixation NifU-like protein
MSDLRDLYQEIILDHNRRPRNRRVLPDADRHAKGYNPLCGDRVTVYVALEEDRVKDVAFEGAGCAISTASASLMTEALKGKSLAEAQSLFRRFHRMVTGEPDAAKNGQELDKLAVFSGVSQYPARVKCATLAWHTFKAALENKQEEISTE